MIFSYFTNIILSIMYTTFREKYYSTHFKNVGIETQNSKPVLRVT